MNTDNSQISGGMDRRKVTDHEEYFNGLFPETPVSVPMMKGKYSNNPDEMLITTTGTGIAVCLNDKTLKIGGLAHLLVPDALRNDPAALKSHVERLFDDIVEHLFQAGSSPDALKAKIFGGAILSADNTYGDDELIYSIARDYLDTKNIQISIKELGQNVGRRIHFFPKSGKAVRRLLKRQIDRDILIEREEEFNRAFSG